MRFPKGAVRRQRRTLPLQGEAEEPPGVGLIRRGWGQTRHEPETRTRVRLAASSKCCVKWRRRPSKSAKNDDPRRSCGRRSSRVIRPCRQSRAECGSQSSAILERDYISTRGASDAERTRADFTFPRLERWPFMALRRLAVTFTVPVWAAGDEPGRIHHVPDRWRRHSPRSGDRRDGVLRRLRG